MIDATDLVHVFDHTREVWEALRNERLFITGGTGFVGTWLLTTFAYANRRLELGASAVVLSRDPAAVARRLPELAADPAIALQAGNAVDFSWPGDRFAFVIHAATERWFAPDAGRPLGILDADLRATRHVLEFARAAGTRRLLFTSSGAVYGRQPPTLDGIDEDFSGAPDLGDARAAYGEGKRVSEYMCRRYAEQYGFGAIIARLFAFVGPYLPLDEGYAVGNFIGDALAGRPIAIGGDGTPYRSYLYAADLAIWLWNLLVRAPSCRAYNVGSADALSVLELGRAVAAAAGAERLVPIVVAKPPEFGARPARYVPDIARARRELGLKPLVALPDALCRTLAWHRAAVVA